MLNLLPHPPEYSFSLQAMLSNDGRFHWDQSKRISMNQTLLALQLIYKAMSWMLCHWVVTLPSVIILLIIYQLLHNLGLILDIRGPLGPVGFHIIGNNFLVLGIQPKILCVIGKGFTPLSCIFSSHSNQLIYSFLSTEHTGKEPDGYDSWEV